MQIKFKKMVDDLGAVKAALADLQQEEKALKDMLIERLYGPHRSGENAIDGDLFRATVAEVNRENIDWKSVAAKLNPSHQLINAHTSRTVFHTVRVVARVSKAA